MSKPSYPALNLPITLLATTFVKNKVPHNESKLRKDDYFQALKEFNAIKRRKASIHWREKKECLEITKMRNSKEFWRKLELKHKGVPFNFKRINYTTILKS